MELGLEVGTESLGMKWIFMKILKIEDVSGKVIPSYRKSFELLIRD